MGHRVSPRVPVCLYVSLWVAMCRYGSPRVPTCPLCVSMCPYGSLWVSVYRYGSPRVPTCPLWPSARWRPQASLDQPTQTVMMHRTEPTAQQNLALQLAEKLGALVENNERVLDHKQGSFGGYFRDQKDGYRKGDGGYLRRGAYRQQERSSNY
ncbi:eukaryotic translation initiation factor 3 subunit C-like [Meleagris gallopavo]|uniref:eukaryotic translation initiation factor 3 subunit C-like n=1 Tax=Meleagris gallopavo TaxID=9103 RepID=UPI000549C4E6|nr:eukaryotic translation initiation factor 3 subunit C-like [Meleagris gallopavo]